MITIVGLLCAPPDELMGNGGSVGETRGGGPLASLPFSCTNRRQDECVTHIEIEKSHQFTPLRHPSLHPTTMSTDVPTYDCPPTDGREALERLRTVVRAGRPILGGGAGTGISAKFLEAGGADLLGIYNSGKYRMAGRGSLAGLMPYVS
jgi:hypothetical protein